MRRRLVIPFLAAMVACSGSPDWKNPDKPRAQWDADLADCRRESERDMGPGAGIAPGSEAAEREDPMQIAKDSSVRSRFDSLVADCMDRKGYVRQ